MRGRKRFFVIVALVGIPITLLWIRHIYRRTVVVAGAVIVKNADPRKQLPIEGVEVTATDGAVEASSTSDSSGLFKFTFRKRLLGRHPQIALTFRHADFEPLSLTAQGVGNITVAEMVPIVRQLHAENLPEQTISNVVLRYSIKSASDLTVGSVVRTFEVGNKGDVPCNGASLCSPDGKWRASIGSATIDAGANNQFRNARASCIAGPCPFTKIDASGLENPGRLIHVSAITWSDTATFLVEAEVVHHMVSDVVRNSYPVIFGDALNFTLPPAAEGVSILADMSGQSIVFPIGPANILSWADCNSRANPDETRVYRCELKPGYKWLKAGS